LTNPLSSPSQTEDRSGPDWEAYYKAVAARPPRELLRHALRLFPAPLKPVRLAIDIGCGAGIETRELLRQGWHVLAIDAEPAAIARVQASLPPEDAARLQVRVGSIIGMQLPPADFIWAGLSLPFVPPQNFSAVWAEIAKALTPGGRFAGDFFGTQDVWASDTSMSFHTAKGLKALFRPLHLDYFITERGLRPTATAGVKQNHSFSAIVSRPG
jgi:tellurite methyltransferase